MAHLDRRGVVVSALTGLLCGLGVAWVLWRESRPPPPREPPPVSAVASRLTRVAGGPPSAPTPRARPVARSRAVEVPGPTAPPPSKPVVSALATLDLTHTTVDPTTHRIVSNASPSDQITLTLQPSVQSAAKNLLDEREVEIGAVVAIEPKTGRILAFAERSDEPTEKHPATSATPPAASVFKLITSAALIEGAGLPPDVTTCFHGGLHGFGERHLLDNERADGRCESMAEALGRSSNVVFGKLARKHLDATTLTKQAQAFGFDKDIPFLFPVQASHTAIPSEALEFARSAAGFHHTSLSPLHGALLAAAIANDGLMMAPQLIDLVTHDRVASFSPMPAPLMRVCRDRTAHTLGQMMLTTTEIGTSARYFRKREKSLVGVQVAGKTGTLSEKAPDGTMRHYSWWVGFAPIDSPKIAVAALVVSTGGWRVKANLVARKVLAAFFADVPVHTAAVP